MKLVYLTLALISASTLAFQVALTRFFSLAQGHHFAFMAISLALLGIGASGTYLSLKRITDTTWRRTFSGGAALFTLSVPVAYLAINYLPFDAYQIAWDRVQLLWLVLYYLALTVPFFFSGIVIGAALIAQPEQAGPIYAANLLGSGLGPPLALLALATVGGPGTVFLCALLGFVSYQSSVISYQLSVISHQSSVINHCSLVTGHWSLITDYWSLVTDYWSLITDYRSLVTDYRSLVTGYASRFILYSAITIALLYLTIHPPPLFDVRLTPYKSLSQARLYPGSEVVFSRWNAFSRVDVLSSKGVRSAPGLSFAYPGQLPPQLGLMIDGDNLSPITNPTDPTFTQYLPLSLSFELRPVANVLILEPGGGLAVLTALQSGAQSVTVVQSNHTVVEAVADRFADFNGNLYADPRVTVVIDDPRSFLRRTEQKFDLVVLPLTDSFRSVTAGAYTLSEDYRYTVEAFVDALAHLSPDGLLVVERWLQLPPSETLRLWGTVAEGVRQAALENEDCNPHSCQEAPKARLMALRSLQTSLIVAGRSPFLEQDLWQARQFATGHQFDLIWLPGLQADEANRFSVVPDAVYYHTFANLLTASDPASFFADYPHAITPPTDDHPFFFHFFKWRQTPEILQSLGKTWQPFGGSGYLVLVILLALVVILSAALILLPLFLSRGARGQGSKGAGERGSKGAGEQGGKGARGQGSRGAGEQGGRGAEGQGSRGARMRFLPCSPAPPPPCLS